MQFVLGLKHVHAFRIRNYLHMAYIEHFISFPTCSLLEFHLSLNNFTLSVQVPACRAPATIQYILFIYYLLEVIRCSTIECRVILPSMQFYTDSDYSTKHAMLP